MEHPTDGCIVIVGGGGERSYFGFSVEGVYVRECMWVLHRFLFSIAEVSCFPQSLDFTLNSRKSLEVFGFLNFNNKKN